jgi:hypothetical protein
VKKANGITLEQAAMVEFLAIAPTPCGGRE